MPLQYSVFVVMTLAMTAAVGLVAIRTGQLLQRWQPDRNLLLLPGENLVRLLLIAICIGLGLLSGLPPEMLGWTLAQWPDALFRGLLWGMAMAAGIYAVTQWIVARSGEKYYSRIVLDAILPQNAREMLWTALAMFGVVILEELLFRSLLLGGLQPILPASALLAITSILFGTLHLPQGAWGVVGAAMAGLLLGLIFLTSGSLLVPIAAHYVTNMAQIGQAMRMNRAQ
jgi:membrane protease YdiL (CAAX protease family)